MEKIEEALSALHDINYFLNGWSGRRPWRNPRSSFAYKLWWQEQSEETKKAELELYARGFYKYEGVSMLKVQDSAGGQIHIDDVVKYGEQEAVVMAILDEETVQINPVGAGLPLLVPPSSLLITYSFIEKVKSLRSVEELQAILKMAESRAKEVIAHEGEKKTRSSSGGSKGTTAEVIIEEW